MMVKNVKDSKRNHILTYSLKNDLTFKRDY